MPTFLDIDQNWCFNVLPFFFRHKNPGHPPPQDRPPPDSPSAGPPKIFPLFVPSPATLVPSSRQPPQASRDRLSQSPQDSQDRPLPRRPPQDHLSQDPSPDRPLGKKKWFRQFGLVNVVWPNLATTWSLSAGEIELFQMRSRLGERGGHTCKSPKEITMHAPYLTSPKRSCFTPQLPPLSKCGQKNPGQFLLGAIYLTRTNVRKSCTHSELWAEYVWYCHPCGHSRSHSPSVTARCGGS